MIRTIRYLSIALPMLACSLLAFPAHAQPLTSTTVNPAPASPKTDRLNSPRATMFTFLDAINHAKSGDELAWNDAFACLDWSETQYRPNSTEARILARDLWGVLNRIRLVQPEELPDASSLEPDTTRFTYFPRPFIEEDEKILEQIDIHGHQISLAKTPDGSWKFSPDTLKGIHELYKALKPLARKAGNDETRFTTDPWLRKLMPEYLKNRPLFGLEYWQWLALASILALGACVLYITRLTLKPLAFRLIARFHFQATNDAITRTVAPLGLLAAGLFWQASVLALGLSEQAELVLITATRLIVVLAATWTALRATDLISQIIEAKTAQTDNKIDDVLIPLMRKILKTLIVLFGIIYTAQNLNISIGPMLASLGIGGLAFAFAAKDTIENIFGSISVLLDRPFEVGDWVLIDNTEGKVEEIGFRSTRLRTAYDSQVTIPNAALVRAIVDNHGRRKYRRFKTVLGIEYGTAPEKINAFIDGIRELIRAHPLTRKDLFHVWFQQLGPSSLDIDLIVFFETSDYTVECRERERLLLDILRLADKQSIAFAFPTQTVHLLQPPNPPSPATLPATQTH
jgi:MscS family membrane protein